MNMGSYKSLYYYLFIIQIITLCFKVPPKLNASDAPVREQKYYLKTFDTKITSKAIALVYSFATQNDIQWHSFYPTLQKSMISKTYNPSFLLPHYPPFKLRHDQQTMYNLYSTTTTRNEESVSIFQSKAT